jgi:hypothetical protein
VERSRSTASARLTTVCRSSRCGCHLSKNGDGRKHECWIPDPPAERSLCAACVVRAVSPFAIPNYDSRTNERKRTQSLPRPAGAFPGDVEVGPRRRRGEGHDNFSDVRGRIMMQNRAIQSEVVQTDFWQNEAKLCSSFVLSMAAARAGGDTGGAPPPPLHSTLNSEEPYQTTEAVRRGLARTAQARPIRAPRCCTQWLAKVSQRIKCRIELARKSRDASTERRLGIGGLRASAC